MGCNTSKIDDSEVVIRCKNRKRLLKEAVNSRDDFARAHFAYIQAMKTFGVALLAFAGGSADEHSPTDSPSTPVLSLPKASSPPVPALSPPPPVVAISLPPPPTQPANPPSPARSPPSPPSSSPPPPAAPSSPPAKSSSQAPDLSPPSEETSHVISMPPIQSESSAVSPERSPFSSPFYSPRRDETDDFFNLGVMAFPPPPPIISFNPPPPPSPPRSYGWDFLGLFNPTPIPFHLQEHRMMRQIDELDEEPLDLEQVREEEGIPDLEEELQKVEVRQEGSKEEVKDRPQLKEETTPKISEDSGEKTLEKGVKTDTEMVPPKTEEVVAEREEEVNVETEKKDSEKVEKKELAVVTTVKGQNLIIVARHLQNHFAKACESGKNLSGMLEPRRQIGFLELRDSAKVFNAITWHWSRKTSLALKDFSEDDDLAACGMSGSHASTLERLYAWEKKLYDEVKAGEIIRMAFDKKRQQLHRHDAKGDDHNAIDKTRAIVKSLDSRLIVAIRAIHAVSIRIQKLTEEELYPQLEEILQGLMNMWKVMLECHKIQYEIAMEMDSLGNSAAGDQASEAHRKATMELEDELNKWQRCFSLWINSQQSYIDTLLQWLRLCLMQSESNGGTNMSPYWIEGSRIYALIRNWHYALKRLKDKADVVDAISNFATVVHSLHTKQFEELRQRKAAEGFAKDVDRKTLSIQNMEKKYIEYPENDTNDKQDPSGVRSSVKHILEERRDALKDLRGKMEHEKDELSKAVQDRRGITLSSLKTNLPSIFEAMASFAAAAVEEFEGLHQESSNNKSPPTENGKLPQISEE